MKNNNTIPNIELKTRDVLRDKSQAMDNIRNSYTCKQQWVVYIYFFKSCSKNSQEISIRFNWNICKFYLLYVSFNRYQWLEKWQNYKMKKEITLETKDNALY